MISVTVRTDLAIAGLRADRMRMGLTAKRMARESAIIVERSVKRSYITVLRRRTGKLHDSVKRRLISKSDHPFPEERWEVYTDSPYAVAHEQGAHIRAKKVGKRYLRARTSKGQLRYGRSTGRRLFIPTDQMKASKLSRDAWLLRQAGGQPFSTFVHGRALLQSIGRGKRRVLKLVGAVVPRITLRARKPFERGVQAADAPIFAMISRVVTSGRP